MSDQLDGSLLQKNKNTGHINVQPDLKVLQKNEMPTMMPHFQNAEGQDAPLLDVPAEAAARVPLTLAREEVNEQMPIGYDYQSKRIEAGRAGAEDLLNDELFLGDSDLMDKVKTSVRNVEDLLKGDDRVLSIYDVNALIRSYREAIHHCDAYMSAKKHNRRWEKVRDNRNRLFDEVKYLYIAREMYNTGIITRLGDDPRELLIQAKIYELTNGGGMGRNGKAAVPPTDERLGRLSNAERGFYQALTGGKTLSNFIHELSKSDDPADQRFAAGLPKALGEIHIALKDFSGNKVESMLTTAGDTLIGLTRNAAGQVTLFLEGEELPIEGNIEILKDRLATDLVKSKETYGAAAGNIVISSAIADYRRKMDNGEYRQLFTDYLAANTEYKAGTYANFNTDELSLMCKMLLAARPFRIQKEGEVTGGDKPFFGTTFYDNSSRMINISQAKELLRETKESDLDGELPVTMAMEDKQAEAGYDWDEKEKKVKDLLADLVFSQDSWNADASANVKGDRLKKVLIKHSEALAYLLADLYQEGEGRGKLIYGFIDKLPLFMAGDGDAMEYRDRITGVLDSAIAMIDGVIKEQLPGYMQAGAKLYLSDTYKMINGLWPLPKLSDLINDKLTTDICAEVQDKIDDAVKSFTDLIADNVSEYSNDIFKPQEEAAEENLPDPGAPDITEEERKKRKKARLEADNKKLARMAANSFMSGDRGQGLFTRLVFENYFNSVDTIDRCAMVASMIRGAKPVPANPTEAQQTAAKANYIDGILKGAGPLFQKMMQGVPQEAVPEELRQTFFDMKNNLTPIPKELVEAQLNDIVKHSHGEIVHITAKKSLGSASVGQTFLCDIETKDGRTEEAVIKLLKPDVHNRMLREKKVMLKLAHRTDVESRQKENQDRAAKGEKLLPEIGDNEKGGMEYTYEGQLERIEEELDLTIEAKNVELGRIYDKSKYDRTGKVKAVKLSNIATPTINAMVLKKATGETVNELIERIDRETQAIKNLYAMKPEHIDRFMKGYNPKVKKGDTEALEKKRAHQRAGMEKQKYHDSLVSLMEGTGIQKYSQRWFELNPVVLRNKVIKLSAELHKKQEYLMTFAKKWVHEGIFGEGFYHGDPHDGNIMIDDDGLTAIDFGNCTALNADQQKQISRMLTAAAVGDMKMFRSAFHMMLKPEFEDLYQKKRSELGSKFQEILSLGDSSSTGLRIAAAILEAQKLGLEIPAAVYNFSQGQIRLQNAIDNLGAQIRKTDDVAFYFNNMEYVEGYLDYSGIGKELGARSMEEISFTSERTLMKLSNDPEDIKHSILHYPRTSEQIYIVTLNSALNGGIDSAITGFRDIAKRSAGMSKKDRWLNGIKDELDQLFVDVIDALMPIDEVKEIKNIILENEEVSDERIDEVIDRFRKLKADVKTAADSFYAVYNKQKAIKAAHKDEWEPTADEEEEYNRLRDKFIEAYFPFQITQSRNRIRFIDEMLFPDTNKGRKKLSDGIDELDLLYPEYGQQLIDVHNAYKKARKKYYKTESEEDKLVYEQSRKDFVDTYQTIMTKLLRKDRDITAPARYEGPGSFVDVMAEVISDELDKFIDNVGKYKTLSSAVKLKNQMEED